MKTTHVLILVLIAAVIIAGCIGQISGTGGATQPNLPETPQEPSQPQEPQQPQEPAETGSLYEPPAGTSGVSILSPADGATLSGTTSVGVRVDVTNFRLAGPKAELRDNEGQIHAVLEGGAVKKEQYTPYKVFSFTGVPAGTYRLTIELVDNHKAPTGVSDSVTITLTGAQ